MGITDLTDCRPAKCTEVLCLFNLNFCWVYQWVWFLHEGTYLWTMCELCEHDSSLSLHIKDFGTYMLDINTHDQIPNVDHIPIIYGLCSQTKWFTNWLCCSPWGPKPWWTHIYIYSNYQILSNTYGGSYSHYLHVYYNIYIYMCVFHRAISTWLHCRLCLGGHPWIWSTINCAAYSCDISWN